jgi:hypothetical protein
MKELQLVVGTALCWEGEGSVDVRIYGEFSFALFLSTKVCNQIIYEFFVLLLVHDVRLFPPQNTCTTYFFSPGISSVQVFPVPIGCLIFPPFHAVSHSRYVIIITHF